MGIMDRPETAVEKAERMVSYWTQHGDQPIPVSRWAVVDLIELAQAIIAEADAPYMDPR